MKPIKLSAILMTIAFFVGGCADSHDSSPVVAIDAIGTVQHLSDDDETIDIGTGDPLPASGTITTGDDGRVDIAFSQTAVIRLLANTEMKLAEVNALDTTLRVQSGDILADVQPLEPGGNFIVETPTAVAAVRGTQFWGRVLPEDQAGVFAVREGTVEITLRATGEIQNIDAGQALQIEPGGATANPRDALDAEMSAMDQIDGMPAPPPTED